MRKRLKKLAGWRPGAVLYAVAAVAALLLLLGPLIRLAFYSVPWYDDYLCGRFARAAMAAAPTMGNALNGAWECIRTSWYAWQGTYGSLFFMTLMPGIWGEEYYCIGPIFLILLLVVSVYALVGILLANILKTDRWHVTGISSVSAIMTVVLIHTAQAGFYWYNGGMHYVGMHAFAMLLVAVAVKVFFEERGWKRCLWMALGTLLAFLVAGGNFVTALQGLLVLFSIVALGCILRRRQVLFLLPLLGVYAVGFFLNVTAPGNDKRAESYVGWGMSPMKSVLYSFVEGGRHAWEFTGWMTLLLLLLILPLVLHMAGRTTFEFRMPGLVSLWSVCLYATGFTPSLYSLGHAGLGRTLNAVKLTWQLLLILNLVYWCGWFCRRPKRQSVRELPGNARMREQGLRREEAQKKELQNGKMEGRELSAGKLQGSVAVCQTEGQGIDVRWWLYLLIASAAFWVFWAEPNKAGSFSSYGAYYYIHSGEAYNFYQEYLERVEILNSDETHVVLTPYRWTPWLICIGDLSSNPKDESNRALAEWYGKDEIICVDAEQSIVVR